MTIYNILVEAAQLYPNQAFLRSGDKNEITFQDFMNRVRRVADLELPDGETHEIIAIVCENPVRLLECAFAAWSKRITVAVLDHRLLPDTLHRMMRHIGTNVVYRDYHYELLTDFDAVIKDEIIRSSDCLITFTSGTSGDPKAILHTHESLIANAAMIAGYIPVGSDDRALLTKSLNHVAAFTSIVLPSLMTGCSIVLLPQKANIKKIASIIDEENITYVDMVATMLRYVSLFRHSNRPSSLKYISVNGEHLSCEELDKLQLAFPETLFYYSYGLSEAGPRVTYLSVEDSKRKRGSVGRPLSGIEISIIQDIATSATESKRGEIVVRTPSIMRKYFNNPKLSREKVVDGWLHTGDIGWIDNDGYLFVLGRKDDLIVRGGENIYPSEIEDVIVTFPCVNKIMVFAEKEDLNGNKLIAFVEVADKTVGKSELLSLCRNNLPSFLIPQEVYIIEEMPLLNGKIHKRKVREIYREYDGK
jgi:long-chain acyl-CoA synthetase